MESINIADLERKDQMAVTGTFLAVAASMVLGPSISLEEDRKVDLVKVGWVMKGLTDTLGRINSFLFEINLINYNLFKYYNL